VKEKRKETRERRYLINRDLSSNVWNLFVNNESTEKKKYTIFIISTLFSLSEFADVF